MLGLSNTTTVMLGFLSEYPVHRPSARAKLAAAFLALGLAPWADAATIRVGPELAVQRIADAARIAKDGDTVEILPGEYRGDVAVWTQRRLTLRGVGVRPVLAADGRSAEGKAIWVIRDGDILIENIEFRGTRVPSQNGAGIRFEKGRLTVRNCLFADNQMGLLTGNDGNAELTIEDSVFSDAPKQTQSLPHLLYAGSIARLAISGSRFTGGHWGHLIKSRARQTDLRYNLIHDGPDGQASYEVDLPNGGTAILVGNVIGQSALTQNTAAVSFGVEGSPWRENTLILVHNTLTSDFKTRSLLKIPLEKFIAPPTIVAINNLIVGSELTDAPTAGRFLGNHRAPESALGNPAMLDFRPSGDSPVRGRSQPIEDIADRQDSWFVPTAEFQLPAGTRPIRPPLHWTPGAFQ